MRNFLKYILIIALFPFLNNCEDEGIVRDLNYVTFERGPIGFQVEKDVTSTKDVKVYASNISASDRTYTVLVNDGSTLATSFNVPSTVTIPANSNEGNLTISVTDDDMLEFEAQTLIVEFQDEAGVSLSDALTINVAEACTGTLVQFKLTLDTWPDETTWEVYDLSGTPTVIFSGGPYINPDDDFAELIFDFCLASGNYGVVVYDSYGDGGPTYSVSSADGVLVGDTTLGGSQSSATFTVD